jgi:hypothetical protein
MIRKLSRAPEPVPALRSSASPRTDTINLKPDYALWAARPYWKCNEATALLLGLNPDFIWRNGYFSPEARHLEIKVRDLSNLTASVVNDVSFGRPTPARWLAWAKKCGLTVPAELEAAIKKYEGSAASGELGTAFSNKNEKASDDDIDAMIRGEDIKNVRRTGHKVLWKIAKREKLNCTKVRVEDRANNLLFRPDAKSSVGRPKKIAPNN